VKDGLLYVSLVKVQQRNAIATGVVEGIARKIKEGDKRNSEVSI
jgi:hypothetical protein